MSPHFMLPLLYQTILASVHDWNWPGRCNISSVARLCGSSDRGGIQTQPILGSRSTYLRGAFGGL